METILVKTERHIVAMSIRTVIYLTEVLVIQDWNPPTSVHEGSILRRLRRVSWF